ncbi:acyl carrier protein [Micromonospora sp. WMMD708]|uniref:acyl carrier protein n=1 Tax=Micromonospora sp. WMMD708 TaxID=3403464 RepID=UPI003BF531C4
MQISLDDLRRILREAAGADASTDLDTEILDRTFDELGYDSLALLETAGRIEREYHVALSDAVVTEAETPRALLDVVNAQLA